MPGTPIPISPYEKPDSNLVENGRRSSAVQRYLEIFAAVQLAAGGAMLLWLHLEYASMAIQPRSDPLLVTIQCAHILAGLGILFRWNLARIAGCLLFAAQIPWFTIERIDYTSFTGVAVWVSITDMFTINANIGADFSTTRVFVPNDDSLAISLNMTAVTWIAALIWGFLLQRQRRL